MITNSGKNLIAKYLLNQAPEFASHIAVGIGGNAISPSSSVTFLADDDSLNFEVVRVPILSKGLIKEDGVEKIVFKAQLPTEQRLQITEIGLYPAQSNALAERYDSKIISNFTNSETWTYSRLGSASVVGYYGEIPMDVDGNIDTDTYGVFPFSFMESDSSAFEFDVRRGRKEQPRYLTKTIFVLPESAGIDENFNITASSYYLENSTLNINMGNNLPTDKIKLAFSVLSQNLNEDNAPQNGARFVIQLLNNVPGTPSASVGMIVTEEQLQESRYIVSTVSLSDFTATQNFSWSGINTIRIYSYVEDGYYISLDALKLDNISTINPLYGLVAAEYLKTPDQYPVLKRENSISYIEYRFGLGVS